jgi:hypothetical protein
MSWKRYAKLKELTMTLKDKKREALTEEIKFLQKRITEFDMLGCQREWAYDRTFSIVRVDS